MSILATAPGVVGKSTRIFVTKEDVAVLMGCKESKAYAMVREVNEEAKKRGKFPFPVGKANKYLFSEIYDIPIDDVNRVINEEEV